MLRPPAGRPCATCRLTRCTCSPAVSWGPSSSGSGKERPFQRRVGPGSERGVSCSLTLLRAAQGSCLYVFGTAVFLSVVFETSTEYAVCLDRTLPVNSVPVAAVAGRWWVPDEPQWKEGRQECLGRTAGRGKDRKKPFIFWSEVHVDWGGEQAHVILPHLQEQRGCPRRAGGRGASGQADSGLCLPRSCPTRVVTNTGPSFPRGGVVSTDRFLEAG